MRKILLFFGFVIALGLNAQEITSSSLHFKSAVLEEFTGINCQFCPDGHRLANEMKAAFPDRVVLVNVHSGAFAQPRSGQPDFRTPDGNELDNDFNISGYPAGTINRRVFNGTDAYGRGSWRSYGEQVMSEFSDCNLGVISSYDDSTRMLTVITEVVYSQDSELSTNRLMINMTQDNIIGPQVGSSLNPSDQVGGQYRHNHMLRDFITDVFGEEISNTSKGSMNYDTFLYEIPEEVNGIPVEIDDLEFAAYVAESDRNIHAAVNFGLNDTVTSAVAPIYIFRTNTSASLVNATGVGSADYSFDLLANFPDERYLLEITPDAPSDWSLTTIVDGEEYVHGDTIRMETGEYYEFNFSMNTPSSGFGTYTIKVSSAVIEGDYVEYTVSALNGVSTLLVNGDGAHTGSGVTAATWQKFYTDAMTGAEIENFAVVSARDFYAIASAKNFTGIENIYTNIGWTFPGITDQMAQSLQDFIVEGINVLVAGQDILWDISENGGSAFANNFIRNYLNVDYVSDGDAGNNPVTFSNAPFEFGNIGTFNLFDYHAQVANSANAFFFPDQMSLRNGAQQLAEYDGSNRIAAAFSEKGDARIVHLGFGLEMVEDAEARVELITLIQNYFDRLIISNDEITWLGDVILAPNPAVDNTLRIELTEEINTLHYEVTNVLGQKVLNGKVHTGHNEINISQLSNGLHFVNLKNAKGETTVKSFIKE